MNSSLHLTMVCLLGAPLAGCTGSINRVTTNRIIPAMMQIPDISLACTFGQTAVGGAASIKPGDPPQKAALLAWAASGMCAEIDARSARLDSQVFLKNLDNPGRAQLSTDARIRSEREYALAASRFYAAYRLTVETYGLECDKLKTKDEALYLLGLIVGDLALISDAAAGNPLGIPQNTILDVGRGAKCLDDDQWWGVPNALQAAAWATVPGSAPETVDPWQMLEDAAEVGDQSGVRIARALQVFTAANAGREDTLKQAIIAHGQARDAGAPDENWVLLDEYALSVSMFESDQLWIQAEGHRTERFGTIPGQSDVGVDPFGTPDPFGAPPPPPLDEETQ
ncbi:MAG: hypothetical protein AAFV53_21475 [Myxococcota bacterium]